MGARFLHRGDAIDYTPATAKTAGDVVLIGSMVAVVQRDLAANELGSAAIEGVFAFPKKAGDIFLAGEDVYWNASTGVVAGTDGSGTRYLAGKTTAAAGSAATEVPVKLFRRVETFDGHSSSGT